MHYTKSCGGFFLAPFRRGEGLLSVVYPVVLSLSTNIAQPKGLHRLSPASAAPGTLLHSQLSKSPAGSGCKARAVVVFSRSSSRRMF